MRGGGLLLGGGEENMRFEAAAMAHRTGRTIFAIDYPVPPDHPFPAALDQCLSAYRALLEEREPASLVISGASAGGNLACALLLRAKIADHPLPSGLILMSPEVDLTESGDSFHTLMGLDTRLTFRLTDFNRLYAGDADLFDPFVSPLFGDVSAFPTTFLQSGTRDLFLSNTVRMHRKLRAAGVRAELHIWDGMPHIGFGGMTMEDQEIYVEMKKFLSRCAA
nr:alpha/beta hydrolase [Tardibacter chloracetimidivorans]